MISRAFPFQKEKNKKDKVLFCFHHAGGSAAVYKKWMTYESDIEVVPVELPGNGSRMREAFVYNIKTVAAEFAREIYQYATDKSIVLYGHSMGAAISFFVCYELETKYQRSVEEVIVAGRHAPNCVIEESYHSDMGLDALEDELRRLGGTPEEVFEDKEIRDFLLGKVQMAYKLHESVEYQGEMIEAPIVAHFGNLDIDATEDMMRVWSGVTNGEFRMVQYEGGHFFPFKLEREYFKGIIEGILNRKVA